MHPARERSGAAKSEAVQQGEEPGGGGSYEEKGAELEDAISCALCRGNTMPAFLTTPHA
jgi:hypothetical protein